MVNAFATINLRVGSCHSYFFTIIWGFMLNMDIEKKVEEFVSRFEMEFIDIQNVSEFGRRVLRVFVDKEGGVKLDDCAALSKELGTFLDAEFPLLGNYMLEISSPGIDRVLKKEKDFIKFVGKGVRVTTQQALDNQRNFSGKLLSFNNGTLEIDDVTGKKAFIAFSNVYKARIAPELD